MLPGLLLVIHYLGGPSIEIESAVARPVVAAFTVTVMVAESGPMPWAVTVTVHEPVGPFDLTIQSRPSTVGVRVTIVGSLVVQLGIPMSAPSAPVARVLIAESENR